MFHTGSLILSLPLIVFPQYEDHTTNSRLAEAISYNSLVTYKSLLTETLHHNTITNEELVKHNTLKLLDDLYKTLDTQY